MEKVTDRILWSILVLALGVGLYVFGKPAFSNIVHAATQKIEELSYSPEQVDSSSDSDFRYSEPNKADDTISIVGYSGHKENLTIPQHHKIGSVSYKVTAIEDSAFQGNTSIKQVTIPDSVTSIWYHAFADTKLTSVDLPAGLTSIGADAFFGTDLTNVAFPAGLTSIGYGAFANTKLTSVDIPDSVTSIGVGAFQNTKLTSVDLPAGLTWIKDSVFENTPLTSVDLPANLTSIDHHAFADTKLTSVDFPSSLTSIGAVAFQNTPISAISFKNRVDLGYAAFAGTNLKNVTLPTGSTYKTDTNDPTFDPGVTVTFN